MMIKFKDSNYAYILSNKRNTVLYIGVTSDLKKRMFQHKTKFYKGFASKYNLNKLVYYEKFESIVDAIKREKQLKGIRRDRKEVLINEFNPDWNDLSLDM